METERKPSSSAKPGLPARTQVFLGSAAANAPTDVVVLGERVNRILVIVAQADGTIESLTSEVVDGWFYVRLVYRIGEGIDFNPYRT